MKKKDEITVSKVRPFKWAARVGSGTAYRPLRRWAIHAASVNNKRFH